MSGKPSIITHIFFDVHDVLVDRAPLSRHYAESLGRIMAARYGSTPDAWAQANRRVSADWDSYYADLNLSGDEGLADMWEGLFRTTRALFRLTGTPEPSKAELTALAQELPGLAAQGCDALYPEAADVLAQLDAEGLVLGVISHALVTQVEITLAAVRQHFRGMIWGADNAERFDKDAQRYLHAAYAAHTTPENCLALDDKVMPLVCAREAGMQTIQIRRDTSTPADTEGVILPDLRGLVDTVRRQAQW